MTLLNVTALYRDITILFVCRCSIYPGPRSVAQAPAGALQAMHSFLSTGACATERGPGFQEGVT